MFSCLINENTLKFVIKIIINFIIKKLINHKLFRVFIILLIKIVINFIIKKLINNKLFRVFIILLICLCFVLHIIMIVIFDTKVID